MSSAPSFPDPPLSESQNDSSNRSSRSRSRQKKPNQDKNNPITYRRKFETMQKSQNQAQSYRTSNRLQALEPNSLELLQEKDETEFKSELLRSLLRIEQQREQPIDKFVKIVWTYKGRFLYDHHLNEIMKEPSKFLEKLTGDQLQKMARAAEGHKKLEEAEGSEFKQFWNNVIALIKSKLAKLQSPSNQLSHEDEQKISEVISKPLPELIKLEKQIAVILKNQAFGANHEYWRNVQLRIRLKRIQAGLFEFYDRFKSENADKIIEEANKIAQQIDEEPTSPVLTPYSSINPKLLITEEAENEARQRLAQKIFTQQFEKGREKLQINLSLPHNHGLLSTEIITEQTSTYDQITKQIIEFQKYKRMEEDEEEFNDWVPCETEGRFRDRKPAYLNRVRVTREMNKYGSVHRYTEENPPPKTIQGYKFIIFYPDLYDKQKTPQYYLTTTDDPNYCIITFKAGPPYKDIAFKILKKEWDFTEKSGFESIFAKGILHLYFNFKKPRFRI